MPQLIFNDEAKNVIEKKCFFYDIDEYLNYLIENGKIEKQVIVFPTGKLVRYFKNYTIRKVFDKTKKPCGELQFFTLDKFVELCYGVISGSPARIISEPYKLLLFEEAVSNLDLNFYKNNAKNISPSLLEKLANVIYGLKEDGIGSENLQEDISNVESANIDFFDSNRLQDIVSIYEEYENLLSDKLFDSARLLNELNQLLTNGNIEYQENLFNKIESIFFTGFSEFKKPEEEFISFFAQINIPTIIHIDYSTENGPIFGNLRETVLNLKNSGLKIVEDNIKLEELKEESFFKLSKIKNDITREEYLRKWLFNNRHDLKSNDFNDIIQIFECDNRYHEVECLAKYIKTKILEEEYKPNDFCIAMRKPEIYSDIIREIFSLYKIPVNLSDRFHLDNSPVVLAILSCLDVINYGFRFNDVHKTLENSYIELPLEIDKANLISTAKSLMINGGRIRGGSDNWNSIFESKLRTLKRSLIDLDENDSEDYFKFKSVKDEIERIEKAKNDFLMFVEMFEDVDDKISFKKLSEIVNDNIIAKFKIKEFIQDSYRRHLKSKNEISYYDKVFIAEGIEKDAKALNCFVELLDEISNIHAERYPNESEPLDILIDKMKTAISAAKYNIIEKQGFGVNITSIEQTRGIPSKVMILCGAVDGEFPLSYRTDTFLGKELNETRIRHLQSEHIQFYQFLTNDFKNLNSGEKRLVITYPLYDDNSELVKSSFIEALFKITSLKDNNKIYRISDIKLSGDKQRISDIPWVNIVGSINELNRVYGKTVENGAIPYSKLIELAEDNYRHIKNILKSRDFESTGVISNLTDECKNSINGFLTHPISISDLELYVKCPFKFFLKKFLHIKEKEDFQYEMSPMSKGNLLHQVLYIFYKNRNKEQFGSNNSKIIKPINSDLDTIVPIELDKDKRKEYLDELLLIASSLFKEIKFEHPYFKLDEDRILGLDGKIGILEQWLDSELERIEKGWLFKPVLFELGFGLGKKHPIASVDLGEFRLKGKIDRIEYRVDDEEKVSFLIGDYKTKIKDEHKNKEILTGRAFQIPLYIFAAREILKKYYDIDAKSSGAVYYGLLPSKMNNKYYSYLFNLIEDNSSISEMIPKKGDINYSQILEENLKISDVINSSIEFVKNILGGIENGIFNLTEDEKACTYCQFDAICRKNKRELKHSEEDS